MCLSYTIYDCNLNQYSCCICLVWVSHFWWTNGWNMSGQFVIIWTFNWRVNAIGFCKSYWIKKQIEPFCIHPSVLSVWSVRWPHVTVCLAQLCYTPTGWIRLINELNWKLIFLDNTSLFVKLKLMLKLPQHNFDVELETNFRGQQFMKQNAWISELGFIKTHKLLSL